MRGRMLRDWLLCLYEALEDIQVAVLRIILTIIFLIVCVILTAIVLMQEGKQQGLGTISGAAESYWGKNKGRSMEGTLEKVTKVLAIAFIVIALILNLNAF